jgi:hypothetical protein
LSGRARSLAADKFRLLMAGFAGRQRIGMRIKVLTTLALVGAGAVLALASAASAARTGVTIHHKGRFHFYGFVFSPKPHRCAKGRTVRLFKQRGKTQDTRRDFRVSAQATVKSGRGRYRWTKNTEKPLFQHGRFYAVAGKIPGCQRDSSRTIRVR